MCYLYNKINSSALRSILWNGLLGFFNDCSSALTDPSRFDRIC